MIFDKLRNVPERKLNHGEYITALDIGTEFVKVLIAKQNGDELEVVGVGKSHQSVNDMYSGAIADISGVVRNCDSALADA